MAYSNIKIENPELSKIKTKDDEIKDIKYETEKHDLENKKNYLKLIMNIIKGSIKV